MNELQKTVEWFNTAIPNPTREQKIIQLGCHAEEQAEQYEAFSQWVPEGTKWVPSDAAELLHHVGMELKRYPDFFNPDELDQDELADALLDQIVTAIGCLYMLGHDVLGALGEVNRANFSKFEDGKPVFDENGKITKGKNYVKPNLKPFLNVKSKPEVLHMTEAPEVGTMVYILDEYGGECEWTWLGSDFDLDLLKQGNTFATRELRDRALALRKEGA